MMRSLLLTLGLALVVVGVANVPSAGAVNPPSTPIRSTGTNITLDSNRKGDVYLHKVNGGFFQEWDTWNGGWIKNVETGLCLTSLSPAVRLRTLPCADNPRQFWRWEINRPAPFLGMNRVIRNVSDGRCLQRSRLSWNMVTIAPCDLESRYQLWVAD